jgi:alcohol dehydrogenase
VSLQEADIRPGSAESLAALAARFAARKIMLVTGRTSYEESGARAVMERALIGRTIVRFADIRPTPRLEDIEAGVAVWRAERPDLLVAVGGGSVIDVAKAVNALGPEDAPVRELLQRGGSQLRRHVPLVAIPTTAGSGAEATRFVAYYVGATKRSFEHPSLRPDFALVDARLTERLPRAITASTGLDALCQAIESFWAVGATTESRELAAAALKLIVPALRTAVDAPVAAVREAMARGAYLAGRAIDISKTTAAHALSYSLTQDYGVAHGHSVALVLPAVFRLNASPGVRALNDPPGPALHAHTMARLPPLLGLGSLQAAADWLEALVGQLGLSVTLPCPAAKATLAAADLAGRVDPVRLGNNPVALGCNDFLEIYSALFGRRIQQSRTA